MRGDFPNRELAPRAKRIDEKNFTATQTHEHRVANPLLLQDPKFISLPSDALHKFGIRKRASGRARRVEKNDDIKKGEKRYSAKTRNKC